MWKESPQSSPEAKRLGFGVNLSEERERLKKVN